MKKCEIATFLKCNQPLSDIMIMVYPSCCPVANAKDGNRPGMMQFGKSAVTFVSQLFLRSRLGMRISLLQMNVCR